LQNRVRGEYQPALSHCYKLDYSHFALINAAFIAAIFKSIHSTLEAQSFVVANNACPWKIAGFRFHGSSRRLFFQAPFFAPGARRFQADQYLS